MVGKADVLPKVPVRAGIACLLEYLAFYFRPVFKFARAARQTSPFWVIGLVAVVIQLPLIVVNSWRADLIPGFKLVIGNLISISNSRFDFILFTAKTIGLSLLARWPWYRSSAISFGLTFASELASLILIPLILR
jgi:hypothetical protein